MRFFSNLPNIQYRFGENQTTHPIRDLSRYADVFDQVKNDASVYQFYNVKNGERPDIVSQRIYGVPYYDWTFYIMNDHIRYLGWPLSYQDFRVHLNDTLPGVFLSAFGTRVDATTGKTVQKFTSQFPVGSPVFGSLSGASGTVYQRDLGNGQIFVKDVTGTFRAGEVILDTLTQSPIYSVTVTGTGLAYQAAHHYKDVNGEIMSIDPTSEIPNPSGYVEVTHEEYLENLNAQQSRIRILKPNLITRFTSLYRETVSQ